MSKPEIPLDTEVDRAWYAWHCLPRRANREPPSEDWVRKNLPDDQPEISKGLIGRAMREERIPNLKTWKRIAQALQVPSSWLLFGEGERPTLTGPLRSRADVYDLKLGVSVVRNPLEEAIAAMLPILSQETIDVTRVKYAGHEHERPALSWATVLTTTEHDQRGTTPKVPSPAPVKPAKAERKDAANESHPRPKRKRRSA